MKKIKKARIKSILVRLLAFLLLVLAAWGVYYAVEIIQFVQEISEPDDFADTGGDFTDIEVVKPRKPDPEYARTNILLLGVDARTPNEPSRSDTLMVLSLNSKTREASLLSIPRDSRVTIPGRNRLDKIGHAHAYGGVSLAVATVEEFLDVPIHYYARVNFWGFERIIDSLGGVTINVEPYVARHYPELESGTRRLTGAQALIYVRDRSSDSDIGRVKRQQKLLKAVARESFSAKTLTRLPRILNAAGSHLRTNIPVLDMLEVARHFLQVDLDSIPQGVIPGRGQTIDGVSYWVVDMEKTGELLEELGLTGEKSLSYPG